ncbi:hypothetical protein PVAND_001749 [Polypedilum vanderplanki]|uniref:Uncharacterized protein n=1 Tax=Polypedilum vanderplanki TaxID=319348 RepID=A0A9J6BNW8_POLVA|nr:hypothetical protein PVAND_001749 [Polypedilum vanderplanki]
MPINSTESDSGFFEIICSCCLGCCALFKACCGTKEYEYPYVQTVILPTPRLRRYESITNEPIYANKTPIYADPTTNYDNKEPIYATPIYLNNQGV